MLPIALSAAPLLPAAVRSLCASTAQLRAAEPHNRTLSCWRKIEPHNRTPLIRHVLLLTRLFALCALPFAPGGLTMSTLCTVCTHPQRPEIEVALLGGMLPGRIAGLFRISRFAVIRHRAAHLLPSAGHASPTG